MRNVIGAGLLAAASLWSGLATSGSLESFDETAFVGLSFGGAQPAEMSAGLRLEQPAGIRHALARFGIASPTPGAEATLDHQRLRLAPLAQWGWNSRKGNDLRFNGVTLADEGAGGAAASTGMGTTTKILLCGAGLVAIAAVAAGGGGSEAPAGGGGGGGACVCSAPGCDGQPSGFCGPNLAPDDDGDCSTTCDRL